MRALSTVMIASLLVGAAGCGTMTVTSADPTARLYARGRMLGKGTGEIKRRGTPETTVITAVSEDGRRSQAVAKREFTGFTFLTGLFTYGICLFACWEYPSAVFVPAAPAVAGGSFSVGPGGAAGEAGAQPANDPWLSPPAGWQAPKGQASGPQ